MSNRALSRTIWAIILIVILIIAIGGAIYAYEATKPTTQISISASTLVATQGTAVTFTILHLESGGQATIYFGDGQSTSDLTASSSSTSHTYENAGTYLVTAQETSGGSTVSSTNSNMTTIEITPTVSSDLAPYISVPTIAINSTTNPSEPVVTENTPVVFSGGYLEIPTDPNTGISEYTWNFGNGVSDTIPANSTTSDPTQNPVSATYTQTGLYPVSLTLETVNCNTNQTYTTVIERTVVVSSATQTYALFVSSSKVPNPGVISVAENVAGGPYSFDPQIDYETVGYEVVLNIMGTLLVYNGSSTTDFLPMIAASIPSVSNGGVNANDTAFTFTIRDGLKFSNGDPITAYDVWYTMIRNLLFVGGAPGTPDWILAQYLVPGATIGIPIVADSTDTADYNAIMNAVTYDNSSNTVTFNLVTSTAPGTFFTSVVFPLGTGIIDANWLQSVGAGITFSPAGFYAYQNQGNENSYNSKVQTDPVTSGPYQIQSYVPGQSIVLIPNPGFTGTPGIPAVHDKILVQWVKDPETAYLLYTSGQADIVTTLPSSYMQQLKPQAAAGTTDIYAVSSLSCFFYVFNINVDTALMKSTFGSDSNMPSDYFANTLVREAFTDAFNYTNYIDEILGNNVYGENFGSTYAGVIIPGLPDYVPPSQLSNVSTYDLTQATQLMQASGDYNVPVNIPIVIPSGDTTDYAAAQMWGAALHQMDSDISISVQYQPFATQIGEQVADQNPMPLYWLGWIADYPLASDFVNAMYEQGGTYPAASGFTTDYLNSVGYPAEAAQYTELNTLIQQADTSTNPDTAAQLYKQAEQNAINLYMYAYILQPNVFWVVKPYMTGYNGIQSQENPEIGGALDSVYYWWIKG